MRIAAPIVAAVALASAPLHADLVSVQAVADATLYQSTDGSVANGAGQYSFAGRTNQGFTRRALVRFDLAGAVPTDATITAVRLVMNVSQANGGVRNVSLHRALTAWTTGASDPDLTESNGAPALAGDATWLHASYQPDGSSAFWTNAGGDYAANASSSLATTTAGLQTWESAGLLADVLAFRADPSSNLGWFLIGDESVAGTARRFDSADSAALGGIVPRLEIEFTAVPEPGSLALIGTAALLAGRRRRS